MRLLLILDVPAELPQSGGIRLCSCFTIFLCFCEECRSLGVLGLCTRGVCVSVVHRFRHSDIRFFIQDMSMLLGLGGRGSG